MEECARERRGTLRSGASRQPVEHEEDEPLGDRP